MIRLERVTDTLPEGMETGKTRFDRPGEGLFAAYSDGVLAGIGGLTAEPAISGAFRMRRFYVRTAFRRASISRQLANTLLDGITRPDRFVTASLMRLPAASRSGNRWGSNPTNAADGPTS